MALGYHGELFILAFDHRGSFKKKMFSLTEVGPEDQVRLESAKRLVWDGFKKAHAQGLPDGAGILVDEEMGAQIAREAGELGIPFAMPVEKSGQAVFDFEYGDGFSEHIEAFDPTFAKVLVRWNPDDETETKTLQGHRLSRLGSWLHDSGRLFLFELLVPASEAQLAAVDGDADRYDRDLRPAAMLQAIEEIRSAGVEPDIWKIEGIDDADACRRVADRIREGDRSGVLSVVLGRGADATRVEHWLRTASPVEGYGGFAIGRSIWWDAVASWRDASEDADAAAGEIADAYRHFIDVYTGG